MKPSATEKMQVQAGWCGSVVEHRPMNQKVAGLIPSQSGSWIASGQGCLHSEHTEADPRMDGHTPQCPLGDAGPTRALASP